MMYLIFAVSALLGFVFGYFLSTPAIVILSICAATLAYIFRPKSEQEIGALVGVVIWIVLGTALVVMWGTHLYVSDTLSLLPNLGQYILRQ